MDALRCLRCEGKPHNPSAVAGVCEDCFRYRNEVLTEAGIVRTNALTGKYVQTLPNDDKVTMLLREAVALLEQGDRDGFVALYCDEERLAGFTMDERFTFKGTKFPSDGRGSGNGVNCLFWINEAISIAASRTDADNEEIDWKEFLATNDECVHHKKENMREEDE